MTRTEALSSVRDALMEKADVLIRLHCAKLAAGGLAPQFVEGAEEWAREECGVAIDEKLAEWLAQQLH